MKKDRNWTILFIGGASGVGKSSIAYELARFYNVNVIEVDDIGQSIKAMTTKENLPAIHYFSTGVNWKDIGVSGNVKWLIDVSKEMIPGLKAIVENHIESDIPVIIEGDFLYPEFTVSFENPKIKSLYVHESDKNQILQNYLARESGELQRFRADISAEYGNWLANSCRELGIEVVESRPWNTAIERIIEKIL